ncbi:Cytokinin-O-glucosyltransferase 2 [Hordeum vulgare]|nr:Cytokinin-O-glucosyltransferase 2 [Hordeum vulgare]
MVKKVFNIPSGNRTVELYKRHEQCDLRNIYHKNSRAPIAHTIDVLHKARNDDGDTTKRSWVLLALETVLTPRTGNMVPIEYMKSLEDIENVTEYARDEHVLSVAMNEFRPVSETTYAALYPEGGVIGVDVGNNSTAAQDVDCDDTQDCGAADVNINGKRGEIGAKDNISKILIQWKMGKVQKKMCVVH